MDLICFMSCFLSLGSAFLGLINGCEYYPVLVLFITEVCKYAPKKTPAFLRQAFFKGVLTQEYVCLLHNDFHHVSFAACFNFNKVIPAAGI